MTLYHVSRAVFSVALGTLAWLLGMPLWGAALMAIGSFAFFLWAPRSGLYVVRPERGIDPLQGDERAQAIVGKAAYTALLVTWLALGGLTSHFWLIAASDVPVHLLSATALLSLGTFIATWFWLRGRM